MYRQVVIASFFVFCSVQTILQHSQQRYLHVFSEFRKPEGLSGGWTFRKSYIRLFFGLLMNI